MRKQGNYLWKTIQSTIKIAKLYTNIHAIKVINESSINTKVNENDKQMIDKKELDISMSDYNNKDNINNNHCNKVNYQENINIFLPEFKKMHSRSHYISENNISLLCNINNYNNNKLNSDKKEQNYEKANLNSLNLLRANTANINNIYYTNNNINVNQTPKSKKDEIRKWLSRI